MTGHLLTAHLVDGHVHVHLGPLLADRADLAERLTGQLMRDLGLLFDGWPTDANGVRRAPGLHATERHG